MRCPYGPCCGVLRRAPLDHVVPQVANCFAGRCLFRAYPRLVYCNDFQSIRLRKHLMVGLRSSVQRSTLRCWVWSTSDLRISSTSLGLQAGVVDDGKIPMKYMVEYCQCGYVSMYRIASAICPHFHPASTISSDRIESSLFPHIRS